MSEATAPSPAPAARQVVRLTAEMYRKLEQSLPQPVTDRQATDAGCDASFKLGIQYVLQKLRDGWVME